MKGHEDSVYCLQVDEGRGLVVSGSVSPLLRSGGRRNKKRETSADLGVKPSARSNHPPLVSHLGVLSLRPARAHRFSPLPFALPRRSVINLWIERFEDPHLGSRGRGGRGQGQQEFGGA